MKRFISFSAVLLIGTAAAQAQVYTLDHFNCYQIQATPPPDAVVDLSDQFGSHQAINVQSKFRFCNPTFKGVPGPTGGLVVTPITHPNDHLTFYHLSPQPPVNLNVLVSNQFGEQTLTVFDARYLAVPTQKSPHPQPPVDLDHFQCYAATGHQLMKPAALKDEFHSEQVQLISPVLLCNPVKKRHNGVITDILHPDNHLVCYTKTPRAFVTQRNLRNQFGTAQAIATIASDLLCVPSKKAIQGPADVAEQ